MSDPVKFWLAIPPEVMTEYAGTQVGRYYTDIDVMLETQRVAYDMFLDRYDWKLPEPGRVDAPAYVGATALGAKMYIPDNDQAMIRGYPLTTPESLDLLELPNSYFDTHWAGFYRDMRDEMQAMVGDTKHVTMGHGQEGPVTTAKLLRGEDFLVDLHTDPARAHRVMDIATESFIQFGREIREVNRQPLTGGMGICDDFAGLISPAMWPEFVMPYLLRIYEAFEAEHRSLHSELLRVEHLPMLNDLGVTHFDPGQDQYLELKNILDTIDIPTSWNIPTVRVMLQSSASDVADAFHQAMETGATEIMVSVCPGTPPENVIAFLEAGRHYD